MVVHVDLQAEPARVTLEEAEDLESFMLVASGGSASLADAVAPLGRLSGDEHVYLAPEAVIGLAGPLGQDAGWRERFEAMVAYARGKGWTDDEGAIRAHVERR